MPYLVRSSTHIDPTAWQQALWNPAQVKKQPQAANKVGEKHPLDHLNEMFDWKSGEFITFLKPKT